VAKTNARYVEIVKGINAVAPELVEKIRAGKLNVPEAKELSDLPSSLRAKAIRAINNQRAVKGSGYGFRHVSYATSPHSSDVYTPPDICRFLHDLISPHYNVKTILDPSAGKGALTHPWREVNVVAFEIAQGRDFLAHQGHINCDLVLCNPPFNNENGAIESPARVFIPALFLKKILEVAGPKTPIALFTPMGMRLNQHRDSQRWRWLRDNAPPITSIISLPLDCYEGVEFHSEILLFNMPRLKPHYFLPDEYLPKHPRPNRRRRGNA
jgi:hypothetical protein